MSNSQDQSKLSEKLTDMMNIFRTKLTLSPREGSQAGTSVKSTIGYYRWTNKQDNSEPAASEESVMLNLQEQTDGGDSDEQENSETGTEAEESTDECKTQSRDPENGIDLNNEDFEDGDGAQEPPTNKVDSITEWQAGWNVTNAIQGMFIVSFPYTIHQGGYWSLMAMVLVAYICCYTGKILVECLYDEEKDGQLVRVRTSYGDIAQKVFGERFGKPIINTAQVIELLMTCILYVLLCGELLRGTFYHKSVPLSAWISLSTVPLLLCAFIKTMRRVSWLSLWCSVAHLLINIIIIIYCFTLVKQWKPKDVKIKPSVGTVPIALGIIVFSYTSQIFLPTLEGKMVHRDRFTGMLNWTHIAAAIFKVVFSYIGYITWGEDTEEVITNNLPTTLRVVVNVILVAKALLSYPLPYFAAVDIIEGVMFQDQAKTVFPSCYNDNMSIKWWGIICRLFLVVATMLMAIFIPHFAILMGLIGSFTGTMLSFVWPCIFHLYLRRNTAKWYRKLADVVIIILGVLCGIMGIYSSSSALIKAAGAEYPKVAILSDISETAVNETLKSTLLG